MKKETKISLLTKKSEILEVIVDRLKNQGKLCRFELAELKKVDKIDERLDNAEKLQELEKRMDEMENQ